MRNRDGLLIFGGMATGATGATPAMEAFPATGAVDGMAEYPSVDDVIAPLPVFCALFYISSTTVADILNIGVSS